MQRGKRCPIDDGVDIAVTVRRADADPEPSGRELGVLCAIRAGVPVVTTGDGSTDVLAGWVSGRALPGAVATMCDRVVAADDGTMLRQVDAAIAPVLSSSGTDPADVAVSLERRPDRLVVHLETAGSVPERVTGAIAVRAVAALTGLRSAVARRPKSVVVDRG
jgi:hypothetical protein